jgi:hypothetical protein
MESSIEPAISDLLEKAKNYYISRQTEERVKIRFKDLRLFERTSFRVMNKHNQSLSIFVLYRHAENSGYLTLQDLDDDYEFTDMKLLEEKIYEIIDKRVDLINTLISERKD